MASADTKLQLIIEAINNTEVAFKKVKKDLLDVQATGAAVGQAGAAGASSWTGLNSAVGAAKDHITGAKTSLAAMRAEFAAYDDQLNKWVASFSSGMENQQKQTERSHSMLARMVALAAVFGSAMIAEKLVSSGIEYNKALEISQLGISAIMTSMGVIKNEQGEVLTGQQKWNAAQQLSVEAQRELQKIGMETPATYEELVTAYQGLEAPMLAAKVNFQDSLELTGLLTNSVKAIGLPMEQIVQEGRDILSGTINQHSQLAKSLGITNEDVKLWRQKGTIVQELKKQLEGFVFASSAFADTWDGAWSNFKDIAQRSLGEGMKPLFNMLKQEMIQISGEMVNITRDPSGKIIDIQVKPEVIAKIKELASELERLIRFMEKAAWVGSKLAEPLIWGAIALGVDKITKAIKALATAAESGALARLISSLPTLALVAGLWAGKQAADYKSLSDDASGIRNLAKTGNDHESARLRAGGINPMQHLEEFGPDQLEQARKKLPTATDTQIATMLRRGIISTFHDTTPWQGMPQNVISLKIDDTAAKKYLEGAKTTDTITGNGKKTAEEIKKENNDARAAIEDSYSKQIDAIKKGEMEKVEAYKTGLKNKELLFQQGAISEEEYLKAQADAQKNTLQTEVDALNSEQKKLTEEWNAKSGKYNDSAERSKGHKEYVNQWYKLEEEKTKKGQELARALTEEEIKQIEHRRQVETAQREGALKLLQEQLAGEKQMTQLLLEREKITPLEAEKRNVGTEQKGLEADYWNTFAKLQTGGLTSAQIIDLRSQLSVLEQRMDTLSAAEPDRLYKAGKETTSLQAKREEARIAHELSDLDEKERMREVSKTEALVKRKGLLEEQLAAQQKVLAGIDAGDTTAWNSQQSIIDSTRQKILEVKLAMRDLSDDIAGGLMEGLQQYADETGGVFKQMVELSKSTASAMQQSFSDFFFDAMQNKLKSFNDYFNSFLASVERALANVMSQQVVLGTLSGMGISVAGFRAEGGSVTAGQPYVVGEKGMEIFIPQASGYILPNHALGSSSPSALGTTGGLQFTQQISIDNRGNASSQGSMDSGQASQLGKGLQALVTQYLIQQQRPGGILYRG